jgi:hypothetical protein
MLIYYYHSISKNISVCPSEPVRYPKKTGGAVNRNMINGKKTLIVCLVATIMVTVSFTAIANVPLRAEFKEQENDSKLSVSTDKDDSVFDKIYRYRVLKSADGLFSEVGEIDLTEEEIQMLLEQSVMSQREYELINSQINSDLILASEEVLLISAEGKQAIRFNVLDEPMMILTMGLINGCAILAASIMAMAALAIICGVASIPLGDIAGWVAIFAAEYFAAQAKALALAYQDLGCGGDDDEEPTLLPSLYQSTEVETSLVQTLELNREQTYDII